MILFTSMEFFYRFFTYHLILLFMVYFLNFYVVNQLLLFNTHFLCCLTFNINFDFYYKLIKYLSHYYMNINDEN
jgi:hypothetical protein